MCEKCEERRAAVEKPAKSLGHVPESQSDAMSDRCVCLCGWQGTWFWDGEDLAWDEWAEHAKQAIETGQRTLNFDKQNVPGKERKSRSVVSGTDRMHSL